MARGMPWLRLWTNLHGKGKALALTDSEFRLLTRIWALGRESERPGWVFVVEGVGWDPRDLARTAGCRGGRPDAMLARLVELRWIVLHPGNVIEVHDWEEHNPPVSPSKTPEARRQQKRKERGQGVARRQDGDTLATGPSVGRTDVDVDVEGEREAAAALPAAGVPAGTSTSAQGAAGTAEAQQHGPGPARVQPPAAPATDDPPRRSLPVEDYADEPPPPAEVRRFLAALEQRMCRTAPFTGGNRDVLEQIRAALAVLPEPEAVECVYRRDVDGARSGSRVKTLRLVAAVLADEVSRRRVGDGRPKTRKVIGADDNGQPIFAEAS